MSEDWENDPRWRAYVTRVRTDVLPKVAGSTIGISIVPTDPRDFDVKFAVELGAMIMLDKPILLVIDPTTLLPERLRRVADEIVVGRVGDEATNADLMAALERMGR